MAALEAVAGPGGQALARRPPGEILRRGSTRPRPTRVGASAWEHLEVGLEGGRHDVSSVLLLLPTGTFHAAVCAQREDGDGEDLTAATHGSWCACRGGVRLEFPDEDAGADELEYELRNGHLVASTGALPEGLVQEYAPGQPDSALVQMVARHLLIDPRVAFGQAAELPAAGRTPAILDEGAREVVAEEELAVRPPAAGAPAIFADGDGDDSDGSLGGVLAAEGAGRLMAGRGAATGGVAEGAAEDEYDDDDFETPSEEDDDEP